MRLLKKYFSLACLFSLLLSFVNAQIINIDKTDTAAYVKKAVWKGNIAAGLEVDKQKTTLYDASNFLDVLLQKYHELFILSGSYRFTYNGPQDFLNQGYIHLRWRHQYRNKIHPETYIQYQWDNKIGMIHRFVTGINLRYNFWHSHLSDMSVATGLMYENELWNYVAVDSAKIPPNPVNQKTSKLKSNSYIKWEGKLSTVSNISIIIFYQAAFNDFFQPRIASNIKFDIDISRHFALALSVKGLYDAKPVVPIFHFYYSYSNDLVVKF